MSGLSHFPSRINTLIWVTLHFIMQLVEKHIIDRNHKFFLELDFLSFQSKNLYNSINYLIRQQYFVDSTILSMKDIYQEVKYSEAYSSLPRKVSNLVIFQVLRDWKSYIEASFEYKIHPEKFLAEPKIPKYKDKSEGRNLVQYDIQAISKKFLKNGLIKLSSTNNGNQLFFDEETDKLDTWADEAKKGVQVEIDTLDKDIKAAKKALRQNKSLTLEEKTVEQRRIKQLEKQRDDRMMKFFETRKDVEAKAEALLDEIEAKMKIIEESQSLFTIRWQLV